MFSLSLEHIQSTEDLLAKRFDVWDLGTVRSYLGVRVVQKGNSITLDQEAYIDSLGNKFGLTDAHPKPSPLDPAQILEMPLKPIKDDSKPYSSLIGSLMYVAVFTRPDIAHAVSKLSQYSISFGKEHWVAAKRVLRFLKGSKAMKLEYKSAAPLFSHSATPTGATARSTADLTQA